MEPLALVIAKALKLRQQIAIEALEAQRRRIDRGGVAPSPGVADDVEKDGRPEIADLPQLQQINGHGRRRVIAIGGFGD